MIRAGTVTSSSTAQHSTAQHRQAKTLQSRSAEEAKLQHPRGGVPFVDVAVGVSQQHQVAPCRNGGAVHLAPTQHSPVGPLGLAVRHLPLHNCSSDHCMQSLS